VPAATAAALAGVLGVDERELRIRPPRIEDEVRARLGPLGLPVSAHEDADDLWDDVAGRPARLVLRYMDLLVRVVVLDEITDASRLGDPDLLAIAHRLLRAAGDTSAVALVAADPERTTQLVEPSDVADAIIAPTGRRLRYVPARVALPLGLALAEYFERMAPDWEAVEDGAVDHGPVDWDEMVRPPAERAAEALRGRRTPIEEKRIAFRSFGAEQTHAVVDLVRLAASGLSAEDLWAALDERSEPAA
jgi:hypothetical protein